MKTQKPHKGTPMFGEGGYLETDLEKSPHGVQRYVRMLEQKIHSLLQEQEKENNLQKCLKLLEVQRYGASHYPMTVLYYDHTGNYWSVCFQNPRGFENPDIVAKTPLEAVHQMFDFLKTLDQ